MTEPIVEHVRGPLNTWEDHCMARGRIRSFEDKHAVGTLDRREKQWFVLDSTRKAPDALRALGLS